MSRNKREEYLVQSYPVLKDNIEIKVPQHEILIGSQTWYNQTISICIKAGKHVDIVSKKNNGYIVKIDVGEMALNVELPEWAIDNGN
jgi:hypothetical protein